MAGCEYLTKKTIAFQQRNLRYTEQPMPLSASLSHCSTVSIVNVYGRLKRRGG